MVSTDHLDWLNGLITVLPCSSACTHQFLCFADQLLFFFPSEAPLSLTPELDELSFFLGHGVSWLWDLSRTPAPSLLSFGRSGTPLVSRRNSSGEELVTTSARALGIKKPPLEQGPSFVP